MKEKDFEKMIKSIDGSVTDKPSTNTKVGPGKDQSGGRQGGGSTPTEISGD